MELQTTNGRKNNNKIVPHTSAKYSQLSDRWNDFQVIAAQIHIGSRKYEHDKYSKAVDSNLLYIVYNIIYTNYNYKNIEASVNEYFSGGCDGMTELMADSTNEKSDEVV